MKKIKILLLCIFIVSYWNCSDKDDNQSEWQSVSLDIIKGCIVNSIVIDKNGILASVHKIKHETAAPFI